MVHSVITWSGRPRTSRSVVERGAVADWWHSWPMASTLASLCLSQRQTFWTYVVTINLFSLYLMNFMQKNHPWCNRWVHYKSMKCDVLFSQGRVRTIFRWGGHPSYMSKKIYSSLQQWKNYKNRSRISKVVVTNVGYCHLFMVHSVYNAFSCSCRKLLGKIPYTSPRLSALCRSGKNLWTQLIRLKGSNFLLQL